MTALERARLGAHADRLKHPISRPVPTRKRRFGRRLGLCVLTAAVTHIANWQVLAGHSKCLVLHHTGTVFMTTRTDRWRVPGFLVMAGTIVFLIPATASACTCALELSPCAAATGSVIFVGTPISVAEIRSANGTALLRFHFDVEDPIQNIDRKGADVTTLPTNAQCGFPFKTGVKYLVYASGNSGAYSTSLCSRTGPLDATAGRYRHLARQGRPSAVVWQYRSLATPPERAACRLCRDGRHLQCARTHHGSRTGP